MVATGTVRKGNLAFAINHAVPGQVGSCGQLPEDIAHDTGITGSPCHIRQLAIGDNTAFRNPAQQVPYFRRRKGGSQRWLSTITFIATTQCRILEKQGMGKKKILLQALLICQSIVGLFSIDMARADTVWMNNGDVLSGDIVGLDAGKLSLQTQYAGTIELDWRYVTALDSDKTYWVSLIGEEEARLRRFARQNSGVTVIDEDGHRRSFSAVWPVAAIHTDKPVIADTWQLGGKLVATLDSKSGNEDELLMGVEGSLNIDDQWNKNAFYWDIEAEDDDGIKSSEWTAGYSYSRYLDEHRFVQAAAEQEYDSEEDLITRTSLGGTVGYRFWETAEKTLKTSGGISQLWEDYQSNASQRDYALTWIFNYRTPVNDNWEYFANSRTFFRLKQSTTLVNISQGIKIGLTDHIVWNLTHIVDYDSDPVDKAQKIDSRVRMGIGYQW